MFSQSFFLNIQFVWLMDNFINLVLKMLNQICELLLFLVRRISLSNPVEYFVTLSPFCGKQYSKVKNFLGQILCNWKHLSSVDTIQLAPWPVCRYYWTLLIILSFKHWREETIQCLTELAIIQVDLYMAQAQTQVKHL